MTAQESARAEEAKKLYPFAALYLGSLSDGAAALSEAAAAAVRKSPDDFRSEFLRQLMRICRSAAPERAAADGFPDDDTFETLLAVLKLPPGSRCNLAMQLCGLSAEEAARARGISEEEYAQKTEKALRQLTFLAAGDTPVLDEMTAAAAQLPWNPAWNDSLEKALQVQQPQDEPESEPIAGEIRKITRSDSAHKTVTLPLWGAVCGGICLLMVIGGLVFFSLRKPARPEQEQELPEHVDFVPDEIRPFQEYLTLSDIQKKTAEYAQMPESEIHFVSTKLKPDEAPPRYELTVLGHDHLLYEFALDAKTGELLSKEETDKSLVLHCADWKSAAEMREAALRCAALKDALFLKEKCGDDDESGYYKYELLDGNGVLYDMQFDAVSGMLMKYAAETPKQEEPAAAISPEAAKHAALVRAGNPDPSQVIFTKVKQDSGVYLIAFTLDDGTQYMIELNAVNAAVNTVDVIPVSADVTGAIGMVAAKERALAMAGLLKEPVPAEFTKAKIERGNGAYVYELEFETPEFEFEVTLNTVTGGVLKYRARPQ
jgi:uncharacterized membrane protein YkoI